MRTLTDLAGQLSVDALVIVGEDHKELFHEDNMPAISVYWGGLSHFVVLEELDRTVLRAMRERDDAAIAAIPEAMFRTGTSEIKNWVVAATALQDLEMKLIDYVPAYRSAAGTGTPKGSPRPSASVPAVPDDPGATRSGSARRLRRVRAPPAADEPGEPARSDGVLVPAVRAAHEVASARQRTAPARRLAPILLEFLRRSFQIA